MGKSGVSTGFAKCFILFMAIVILVQGLVFLGLSIWGLTQETCPEINGDISSNPFKFVTDLIYFVDEDCSTSNITLPNGTETELEIDWTKSYMVTNRMYIFLIIYAVVSGLWIVTSLLVMATICGPVTRRISAIVFWPWFLVVIMGSILDAVATGYHVHDIVNTMSAEKTFDYIGITKNSILMTYLKSFDAYFITPAVVMTCVSSRVIIIWLLNIFGTSFCLSLSRVLSAQRKHAKHKKHSNNGQNVQNNVIPATTAPYPNQSITRVDNHMQPQPQSQQIQMQQMQQQQLQSQPQPKMPFQGESTNVQNRPSNLRLIATAPTAMNPNEIQRQAPKSPYSPNAPALTPDVIIVENVRGQEPNRQKSETDETTYRKTESHPDRLDYPAKSPQSPNTTLLSSVSMLNNRYSVAPNSNSNQAPQRASEELRSQLPWSYTNMTNKPQPPRKPQFVKTYPDIPEPDYNEESRDANIAPPTGTVNEINQSQQAYSRW